MDERRRVWVVGLSDIGRSPRLQNHAISLATQGGYEVDVIGYSNSTPLPALTGNDHITIHNVPGMANRVAWLPQITGLPLKAGLQLLLLFWMLLFRLPRPQAVLLQVPPAIPTLFLCWLVCWIRRAKLVVDWHNFAYTLMAITHGNRSLLVKVAAAHEKFWGRRGHSHLCVTVAMQTELAHSWGISATVFHDRAPAAFHRSGLTEAHDLLLRLTPELEKGVHPTDCCAAGAPWPQEPVAATPAPASPSSPERPESEKLASAIDAMWSGSPSPPDKRKSPSSVKKFFTRSRKAEAAEEAPPSPPPAESKEEAEEVVQTICTESRGSNVSLRVGRPALIVSSTSWTPDEDFSLLLEAATIYDKQIREERAPGSLPRLLILVTGKGPQRAMYQQRMRDLDLRHVAFRTLWLEPQDYPLLLGACDAGVSLHTSSSGLDLPMKVVDMFGCGLPVFSAAYPCISELVRHGVNGLHFSSSQELAEQLESVFLGFPSQSGRLKEMQEAVWRGRADGGETWEAEWEKCAQPVFTALAAPSEASQKSD